MIAALNLIPLALLALAAWSVSKKSRAGLIGVVLLAAVYAVVQPSYLPKGTVERSPVPAFTPSDAPIEDRNRKPTPIEERDQRMQEAVRKGLDFKPSP